MPSILDKIADLDEALGNSAQVSHRAAQAHRATLAAMARDIKAEMGGSKPARINETAAQAASQGGMDGGRYLPAAHAFKAPTPLPCDVED